MNFPDGRPKGLHRIVSERKVDTSKIVADEMSEVLSKFSDFKNKECMIEQLLRANRHIAVFLPKFFHPELNPIERVWAQLKQFT